MIVNEKQQARLNALTIRECMNMDSSFIYTEDMLYVKEYHYVDNERKVFSMSEGDVNTISDCFILYALAILGCANISAVSTFLQVLKSRNKELLIPDCNNKDFLKARFSFLKKYGFVYNIRYDINHSVVKKDSLEEISTSTISLYTLDKEALTIMNHTLLKRIKPNRWIENKPIFELIGKAASAYVVTELFKRPTFEEYLDGIYRGRECGTVHLDNELKTVVNNTAYYIATISLFLHMKNSIMTTKDFLEVQLAKVNLIKSYLENRTKKGITKVICVCESNYDLLQFSKLLISTGQFAEHFANIHFTSESVIRTQGNDFSKCFIHIVLDKNEEDGYIFENGADFI